MEPQLLDVRDDLRQGREPLQRIMEAVRGLGRGQSLILRTTFEPIPLYHVLGVKGYSHDAHRLETGDWEILFQPSERRGLFGRRAKAPRPKTQPAAAQENWPAPARSLDNRGLTPPEPMMRILSALEEMAAGEVLEAFNDREPLFLYPELEARGHEIRVQPAAEGTRLLIRHSN